jgi:membrane-associated protease RseP (regulator of RpoE activity)
MLNMDMVGHLKEDKTLAVYGTGTTPVWPAALENANADSLKYVFSESGVGPSDHTSFYLEDLPVLHFFTGQHEQYHKPTDDIEFINFRGITMVVDLLERLIVEVDDDGKLPFVKTQDQDNESSPNFKVTLGVIPDYLYDGEGMRIDGVSEERPAHLAGLIKGDIVLQMGEHKVTDMMTYMEGLSIFSPGDSTSVTVKRGEETLTFTVHWD